MGRKSPIVCSASAAYAATAPHHERLRGAVLQGMLRNEDDAVMCATCTVARNPFTRMRGLLGRRGLAQGEGLLLQPAGSIHTFFMRFPIDVVFLDRDGRVLRVAESVRPWRTAAARGARAVLELRAGESGRRHVAVGDVLEVGA
jgi:uncharacterized protein